ncbi:hypothetical protein H2198_007080 [Neophaeococcomyces mojaviensis]|uniref:Uncharacterized protein n=1 Tax=Neophaeococcomyces mojaviensis TaxID=3383035 RepID=A0ACC3A153_9EURO|nr:hypothetical protein H2198_007080 [Knufia sp. JES_112]
MSEYREPETLLAEIFEDARAYLEKGDFIDEVSEDIENEDLEDAEEVPSHTSGSPVSNLAESFFPSNSVTETDDGPAWGVYSIDPLAFTGNVPAPNSRRWRIPPTCLSDGPMQMTLASNPQSVLSVKKDDRDNCSMQMLPDVLRERKEIFKNQARTWVSKLIARTTISREKGVTELIVTLFVLAVLLVTTDAFIVRVICTAITDEAQYALADPAFSPDGLLNLSKISVKDTNFGCYLNVFTCRRTGVVSAFYVGSATSICSPLCTGVLNRIFQYFPKTPKPENKRLLHEEWLWGEPSRTNEPNFRKMADMGKLPALHRVYTIFVEAFLMSYIGFETDTDVLPARMPWRPVDSISFVRDFREEIGFETFDDIAYLNRSLPLKQTGKGRPDNEPFKCKDPECRSPDKPHKAKGLCATCYSRQIYRFKCRNPECESPDQPHRAKGLCTSCYSPQSSRNRFKCRNPECKSPDQPHCARGLCTSCHKLKVETFKCKNPNCNSPGRPHAAKGLCTSCYNSSYSRERKKDEGFKCKNPGCESPDQPHKAKGLCISCYSLQNSRNRFKCRNPECKSPGQPHWAKGFCVDCYFRQKRETEKEAKKTEQGLSNMSTSTPWQKTTGGKRQRLGSPARPSPDSDWDDEECASDATMELEAPDQIWQPISAPRTSTVHSTIKETGRIWPIVGTFED